MVTHVKETFETSPFVGIHIRRGDKIIGRGTHFKHDVEVIPTELFTNAGKGWMQSYARRQLLLPSDKASAGAVKVLYLQQRATNSPSPFRSCAATFPQKYLATAVRYLEQEPNGTSVDAIKGIWVASDEATVVMDEVHTLADAYFPSAHSEDIVFAAVGVPGGAKRSKIASYSIHQVPTRGGHEIVSPLQKPCDAVNAHSPAVVSPLSVLCSCLSSASLSAHHHAMTLKRNGGVVQASSLVLSAARGGNIQHNQTGSNHIL